MLRAKAEFLQHERTAQQPLSLGVVAARFGLFSSDHKFANVVGFLHCFRRSL
jgi:hypothetical protein